MSERSILTLETESSPLSSIQMSRSPFPSAGTEEVFQGSGEDCGTPPPSPPPSSDLDTHLQTVFSSCDPGNTGLVSAGILVDYLSSLVGHDDMEKWKVEEFYRMLDPSGHNEFVDMNHFLRISRDWVNGVVAKEDREDVVKEEISTEERVCEENYLRQQVTRMRKEYSELLHASSNSEELVSSLTKELHHSTEKVVCLEKELKVTCDLVEELEELKRKYGRLIDENFSLREKEEKVTLENESLQNELVEERCINASIMKAIKEAKENENRIQSALAEKEFEVRKVLMEMEVIKDQLQAELLKNQDLENTLSLNKVQELAEALASHSFDGNDSTVSQLSIKKDWDEITNDDEVEAKVVYYSQDSANNLDEGDDLGMGSIMEEIEKAVDTDDLPSPVCRKQSRKVDVGMKKTKERLLKLVMTKVGLENDLWLKYFEKEIEDGFNSVLESNFEEEINDQPTNRSLTKEKLTNRLRSVVLSLMIFLVFFTFFGGFEVDHQIYYPITWQLLRLFVGKYLPGPFLLLKYNAMPLVW